MKKKDDGTIIARCPACHAVGADAKGEHLVIYANGKYGCVANPKDKEHSKQIFALVGEKRTIAPERITVKTVNVPESRVIMDLGRFSRFSKTSKQASVFVKTDTVEEAEQSPATVPDVPSGFFKGDDLPGTVASINETYNPAPIADTEEEAMAFLNANAA